MTAVAERLVLGQAAAAQQDGAAFSEIEGIAFAVNDSDLAQVAAQLQGAVVHDLESQRGGWRLINGHGYIDGL